jgi:hypothetical protein
MKVAINPFLKGSLAALPLVAKHSNDFKLVDIPIPKFCEHVKAGMAYTAQFAYGVRRNVNFQASGFLAVNINGGNSIAKITEMELFQNHCGLLYTTPGNTEDSNHCQLVFELATPITDILRMKQATSGIITVFGGDMACNNPCQVYFGAEADCLFTVREVPPLPDALVDELAARFDI